MWSRSSITRIFGLVKSGQGPDLTIKERLNVQPDIVGVFSTSLFGDPNDEKFRKRYFEPLLLNSHKLKEKLPEWTYRVYLAPNFSQIDIEKLITAGYEVFIMNKEPKGYEGTSWRFLAASEPKPFFCVDADDDISLHPIEHIQPWLESKDKTFIRRVIVSNFLSKVLIPIQAGCWGGKGNSIPNIKERLEKYDLTKFGSDEAFLTKEVWPEFKKDGFYKVPSENEGFWFSVIILGVLIVNLIVIIVLITRHWKKLKI
uniref:Uncharacterized protein n=1 Tax=Iridovirus LCIVAC01 TaxID=2506607 RepID=A0A481YR41_9VIRU|nr:MAG: hypothetical protein LCIVAC01_01860 [Iridovirus LCIVAC01]